MRSSSNEKSKCHAVSETDWKGEGSACFEAEELLSVEAGQAGMISCPTLLLASLLEKKKAFFFLQSEWDQNTHVHNWSCGCRMEYSSRHGVPPCFPLNSAVDSCNYRAPSSLPPQPWFVATSQHLLRQLLLTKDQAAWWTLVSLATAGSLAGNRLVSSLSWLLSGWFSNGVSAVLDRKQGLAWTGTPSPVPSFLLGCTCCYFRTS